jgi:hypothetical protein
LFPFIVLSVFESIKSALKGKVHEYFFLSFIPAFLI